MIRESARERAVRLATENGHNLSDSWITLGDGNYEATSCLCYRSVTVNLRNGAVYGDALHLRCCYWRVILITVNDVRRAICTAKPALARQWFQQNCRIYKGRMILLNEGGFEIAESKNFMA